jgi:hypothetical protein
MNLKAVFRCRETVFLCTIIGGMNHEAFFISYFFAPADRRIIFAAGQNHRRGAG